MVAGGAYLASAFATLIVPRYAPLVGQVALPLEVAEVPIIFWLVIRGARTPPAEAVSGVEGSLSKGLGEGWSGPHPGPSIRRDDKN